MGDDGQSGAKWVNDVENGGLPEYVFIKKEEAWTDPLYVCPKQPVFIQRDL